jgi:hypothetical protein
MVTRMLVEEEEAEAAEVGVEKIVERRAAMPVEECLRELAAERVAAVASKAAADALSSGVPPSTEAKVAARRRDCQMY